MIFTSTHSIPSPMKPSSHLHVNSSSIWRQYAFTWQFQSHLWPSVCLWRCAKMIALINIYSLVLSITNIKPAPLPYLTYLRCFIIAATQKQPIGPFCKYWWTRTACRFKEWTLWNNSKVVARSWVRTYRYQPIWISSEKYIIETIVAWVKWHIIKLSIQCTATLLKYQFLNRDT